MKREIILSLSVLLAACSQQEQTAVEIRPDEIDGHARVISRFAPPAPVAAAPTASPTGGLFRQKQPRQVTLPPAPLPAKPVDAAAELPALPQSIQTAPKPVPAMEKQVTPPAEVKRSSLFSQKQPTVAPQQPAIKETPAPAATIKPEPVTPPAAQLPAPAPKTTESTGIVQQKQPEIAAPAPKPEAVAPRTTPVQQTQPKVATPPPAPKPVTVTPRTTPVQQTQPKVSTPPPAPKPATTLPAVPQMLTKPASPAAPVRSTTTPVQQKQPNVSAPNPASLRSFPVMPGARSGRRVSAN